MKIEKYQNFLQEAVSQSSMVARNLEFLVERTNKMMVLTYLITSGILL